MIVYIAGPYTAPTRDGIARNIRRAVALGRYAAHLGHTPLVPHAQGWMGVYGAGDESEAGVRELALRCSRELAARAEEMWVIERDDLSLSEGTRAELEAFGRLPEYRMPWSAWCMWGAERRADLEALAEPPVSATLATALDVHLDHAEDTGRYSDRLRQRVAGALPGMRIAGPWVEDGNRDRRYGLDGNVVAELDWSGRSTWCAVEILGRQQDPIKGADARDQCDVRLRAAGLVLVDPPSPNPGDPCPVCRGSGRTTSLDHPTVRHWECGTCDGTGRVLAADRRCPDCGEAGRHAIRCDRPGAPQPEDEDAGQRDICGACGLTIWDDRLGTCACAVCPTCEGNSGPGRPCSRCNSHGRIPW